MQKELVLPICDVLLETPRLIIRTLTKNDISDLHKILKNPNIHRFGVWEPHTHIADTQNFLDIAMSLCERNALSVLALVLKDKNQKTLIGTISLFQRHDLTRLTLELGYTIGEQWWGKGYVFEGTQRLINQAFLGVPELQRIEANCAVENKASWRVMEKLGMQREGVLRNYFEKNGYMYNFYMYSILKSEWRYL
jgi:ribosomal-protein-alanine N-acetyltransferase